MEVKAILRSAYMFQKPVKHVGVCVLYLMNIINETFFILFPFSGYFSVTKNTETRVSKGTDFWLPMLACLLHARIVAAGVSLLK